MTFTAPLFLLALLPWAALAVYLMIGRRKRVLVPFVELWKLPIRPRRTTRALHVPPISIALMLLALLAALLAASRPALNRPAQRQQGVSVAATRPARNIAITHTAVREQPLQQLHLRVRNDSPASKVPLRVSSNSNVILETALDLPADGTRDYFIDLNAKIGRAASVEILADDDLTWDNRVALSRQRPWPRLEPRAPMPDEVQRLRDAYAQRRPASDDSPAVVLVTSAADLPQAPGVVVVPRTAGTPVAAADASISPHPVTQGIEGIAATLSDAVVAEPPGDLASWTTLMSIAGRPALLIREAPARQVYVGLHSQSLSRTPEFVYLWTNIFNWAGAAAGERLVAEPMPQPPERPAPPTSNQTAPLRRLEGPMLLAALSLALLSAVAWPRRRPHNQSPVQAG